MIPAVCPECSIDPCECSNIELDGSKYIIGYCDCCDYLGKLELSSTDTSGIVLCKQCRNKADQE